MVVDDTSRKRPLKHKNQVDAVFVHGGRQSKAQISILRLGGNGPFLPADRAPML